ncbi:hypothetical protein ALC57_05123 [Trachymyrmex cornetzi]|uniref:Nucleic-acid-binding protein from mobile element jockey n=1 Tax=Trachymyrmex cornetzi TaxID=471704 RepID=A0A151JBJ0_9HYME|nr:hypothetical protein ALC57_05123 [Trachymyrmex cornetzi]
MGKGKILIEAVSANAANKITENPAFSQHNLRAFIPAYKVLRTGVIQDVPIKIDLETLRSSIEVHSRSCKICGNKKHTENEVCPMQGEPNKCINCQGSHTAISKDCPHILKHEHIIGLAAAENIPIADARKIVNSYGNHVPRSNLYLNSGNFPALRTHNRAEGHPNFESHNSFNLLQNNETSNTSRLYADAVRSQIHSQQRVTYSQRNPVNNSPPVFGTAVQVSTQEKAQVRSRSLPATIGMRTETHCGNPMVDPHNSLLMSSHHKNPPPLLALAALPLP